MTVASISSAIAQLVGPCRLLHYGCTTTTLVEDMLSLGLDAYGYPETAFSQVPVESRFMAALSGSFNAVVVDSMVIRNTHDCNALFRKLRPVCGRYLLLWTGKRNSTQFPAIDQHETWTQAAVQNGFRRHLGSISPARYHDMNHPGLEDLMCFEVIPDDVLQCWALDNLSEDRDLHMDMSREAGPRADAHLVRYALACDWIRRGDTVVDCACGLGYGPALMASRSIGENFIGIDLDAGSIDYARSMFSAYGVDYRQGSALDLGFIADRSIDVLTSFETIEHVEDYSHFLSEVARILKPDGRFICSVPNLWVDETGRDPNPYHFHAFDYPTLRSALEKHFRIEARYAQSAPGGFRLQDSPRLLERRNVEYAADEADCEWWIVVAGADPLDTCNTVYHHPDFDRSALPAAQGFHVSDFAAHYQNPWIYRALVQIGERIDEPSLLLQTAAETASGSLPASPDHGAALAVIGYALLADSVAHPAKIENHISACASYYAAESGNPHQYRWRLSLAFLAAQLSLKIGDREAACRHLRAVISFDACRFSPLLATKTIAASRQLGYLYLSDGDTMQAEQAFRNGIDAARRSLHAPDINAIGNPELPLTFGFHELAEVAELAEQCALALRHLPEFGRDPGRFHRIVGIRRVWQQGLTQQTAGTSVAMQTLSNISSLVDEIHHPSTRPRQWLNRTLDRFLGVRLVKSHMLEKIRRQSERDDL